MTTENPAVTTKIIKIKTEDQKDEIKDFAETAMNELLGWYGYDEVDKIEMTANKSAYSSRITPPTHSNPSENKNHNHDDEILTSNYDSSTENSKSPLSIKKNDNSRDSFCGWCRREVPENSPAEFLTTPDGPRYCSESCFSQSRRASFKRAKTCDWCRHIRHAVNYVDFQDGASQLQFCSDKCLNQYKMQIFCKETQAHLDMNPHLKDKGFDNNNSSSLITPDLWFKNCRSRSISPVQSELSRSPSPINIIANSNSKNNCNNNNSTIVTRKQHQQQQLASSIVGSNKSQLSITSPQHKPLISVAPASKLMSKNSNIFNSTRHLTKHTRKRRNNTSKINHNNNNNDQIILNVTGHHGKKHNNNNSNNNPKLKVLPKTSPLEMANSSISDVHHHHMPSLCNFNNNILLNNNAPSLSHDTSSLSSPSERLSIAPNFFPKISNSAYNIGATRSSLLPPSQIYTSHQPSRILGVPSHQPLLPPLHHSLSPAPNQSTYPIATSAAASAIQTEQPVSAPPSIFSSLSVPPITVMVPYPIIIPVPIPIPIPLPIIDFIKAAEKKENNNNLLAENSASTSSTNTVSVDSPNDSLDIKNNTNLQQIDQPLDFTKSKSIAASDKPSSTSTDNNDINDNNNKNNNNSSCNSNIDSKDNDKKFNSSQNQKNIDNNNGNYNDGDDDDEDTNAQSDTNKSDTNLKIKILKLNNKRLLATSKELEKSRPLRKRKRIIDYLKGSNNINKDDDDCNRGKK